MNMPASVVPRPAAHVRRDMPQGPQLRRDFFVYTLRLEVDPLGFAQGAIQIQADSDFELQKLSFMAFLAAGTAQTAATRILPFLTTQITDTGNGRQVFNQELPLPSIFGDGQIPFILPATKQFNANASVAITLTSFDPGQDYIVYMNLIGCKIFKY